jgi:hypothetical protein
MIQLPPLSVASRSFVGSNEYGFNTIYIRRGLVEDALPEVAPETVLAHPRDLVRAKLFDPIRNWEYVEV